MVVTVDDVSRLFLQAVISRKYLSDELAKAICKRSVSAVLGNPILAQNRVSFTNSGAFSEVNEGLDVAYSVQYFDKLITEVNVSLEPLQLELRSVRDEDTGKLMWALVSPTGSLSLLIGY